MRNFLFWLIILMSVSVVNAQHTEVKGMVTDSITGEGLPYAAVILKGTSIGGATDGDGNFVFSIPDAPAVLQISYLGYDSKELQIAPKGKTIELYVRLAPSGITLNEVTVKPKREKYRKKDNPAVEFVRRLIDMRKENNPRDHDYYSYDHYEKMFFAKTIIHPNLKKLAKQVNLIF